MGKYFGNELLWHPIPQASMVREVGIAPELGGAKLIGE
jgi:hypothetical protein